MATIRCDFCPHPADREQMEEVEVAHIVHDGDGEGIAQARTYFFGHPDCIRKFYRQLIEHKMDMFRHMPIMPE